jgi:hypothetical protein
MEHRKIKAYGFLATVEFVEKHYGDAARSRILGGLGGEARRFLETAKKSHWASPAYSSELWAGIVKEHPAPDEALEQLVKAGRYQGAYATNTYLKLLMRMLSVKMFAKKIPDLWSRDANFGTISLENAAEIERGQLGLTFTDLTGFPYFGPICEGWFAFSLETMGLKNLKVAIQDWSLDDPDPGKLRFRISWSA